MCDLRVEAAKPEMSNQEILRGKTDSVPRIGAFWVRKHEACQELLYELAQLRTAHHVSEFEQPRAKYDATELDHGAATLRVAGLRRSLQYAAAGV